jgi:hypothetical protein
VNGLQKISMPAEHPPVLMVVVDTEEEFPWSEFDRNNASVTAMAEVHRAQAVCDEHGVVPTYVADYPVVTQPEGYGPLAEFLKHGRCVVGAHLHPWVTPPFTEEVNARNSYPGNLDRALEQEKLRQLGAAIEQNLGVRPVVYKAGRYGLGPNSYAILEQEGYDVDLSPSPPYDFRADGGPDYSRHDARPFWFGGRRRLLAVPNTGAWVGWAGSMMPGLWRAAARPAMQRLRLGGVLGRLGAVRRVRLSPEGFPLSELQLLTAFLLRRGQRVFVFSYHSSSLKPGCTQYVRDAAERDAFLRTIADYFVFFLRRLGGVAMTPLQLREQLLNAAPTSTP